MKYINLIFLSIFSIAAMAQVNPISAGMSGGQNYISNGGFENSRHGWATYANTAQSTPVTGTGGAASLTLTTTSSSLAGKTSGLINHPASNVQGQGVSYDFKLEPGAVGRTITLAGVYQIASGVYNSSTATTDSDLEMYVYDKDSGTLIYPAQYKLDGVVGQSYPISTTFVPVNNTSSNYRLIFHAASTTTSAFSVKIDSLSAAISTRTGGFPAFDSRSFTASGSWTTNVSYTGTYSRAGEKMSAKYSVLLSGAPNSTSLFLNLPPGLTIDTTKIASATSRTVFGRCEAYTTTTSYTFELDIAGTSQLEMVYQSTTAGALSSVNATLPFTWAAGNAINCSVWDVPIVGWSTNTVTSNEVGVRPVQFNAQGNNNSGTIGTTPTQIIFPTVQADNYGYYSSSTGLWIAQQSVCVNVQASGSVNATFSNNQAVGVLVYKNGSSGATVAKDIRTSASGASNLVMNASANSICLKPLDTLSVWMSTNTGSVNLNSGAANTDFMFTISSPVSNQTINAADPANARYINTAGTSIASGATILLPYPTKDYDSTSAYNGSVYTCSGTSRIRVNAIAYTTALTLATNQSVNLTLTRTTSAGVTTTSLLGQIFGNGSSTSRYAPGGADTFSCNANDTLGVYFFNGAASSASLDTGVGLTHVTFERVN